MCVYVCVGVHKHIFMFYLLSFRGEMQIDINGRAHPLSCDCSACAMTVFLTFSCVGPKVQSHTNTVWEPPATTIYKSPTAIRDEGNSFVDFRKSDFSWLNLDNATHH